MCDNGGALQNSLRSLPPLIGLLAGCTCPDAGSPIGSTPGPLQLALDLDHPATVLATAPSADADCVVRWSVGAGPERDAPLAIEDGAVSAVLFGSPSETVVEARLSCSDGDGPTSVITTGALPSGLPTLEVIEALSSPIAEEWILTTGLGQSGTGSITVSNLNGEAVWWESLPDTIVTAARFDSENQSIYGMETTAETDVDVFLIAHLAGPTERYPLVNGHHDTLALGGGRYLVTQSLTQETDDGLVLGDQFVVIDIADGSTEVVWDAFNQLEVIPNDGWLLQSGTSPADWTHVNNLAQDPDTGKIYASLYYDRSILQIDPVTWETDWELGGPRSDFEVDVPFGPQHSPVRKGSSLWMFDNGANVATGSALREYRITEPVDGTAGTATLEWTWAPDAAPFCILLGSIQLYPDATIASWGDTGEVRILSPEDEELAWYGSSVGRQGGFSSFIELDSD